MVDRGSRYVAGTDGAPPLPPPGGYRGARRQISPRVPGPEVPVRMDAGAAGAPPYPGAADAPAAAWPLADLGFEAPAPASPPAPRRTNALGWTALGAVILFPLILLALIAVGAVDALFGTTVLVLQLVVVGVVIAALCTAKGRTLGAAALALALLLNVGTIGGLGAVTAEATGSYDGRKTDEQKYWEAYPGIKDSMMDPRYQSSLEEVRAEAEATMAAVRERLTERFGIQWVQTSDELLRHERNGYGGESMLQQYTSTTWSSVEPVTGYPYKLEVMQEIEDVLGERGWNGMWPFNDPRSGVDPSVIRKMYGGDEPRDQVVWEWYAELWPDPGYFYADIVDLANDDTGEFRASRESVAARTGEPLEGVSLVVTGSQLLSESDFAEYEDRLANYL